MRVTLDPVRTSLLLTNSNNFPSSCKSSEDLLGKVGLGKDIRELREKNQNAEQIKRSNQRLKDDLDFCKEQLLERDTLTEENGLVIVEDEEIDGKNDVESGTCYRRRVLLRETRDRNSGLYVAYDGPYEVINKVGNINYKIRKQGKDIVVVLYEITPTWSPLAILFINKL
ncbi:hypothetical protein M0802_014168 [Mischocyttarus mexicanus]|nr:hypothetical protein M0802_014168 [Mischocyttarus mexicanus]